MFKGKPDSEEIIELARNVGAMNQQLIGMQSTMEKLDKKIDNLAEQGKEVLAVKLKQEQLEKTIIDLKSKNVDLELRISTLEGAEGNKAKTVLSKVGNYVLAALVGGILFNLKAIINSISGQ